jgi:hypothetical protein
MGRLCFSTYAADMKECDALESNSTIAVVSLTKKYTKDNVGSFMVFLHSNMLDSSSSIVLLGGNRNRVGSMGQERYRLWKRVSVQIGALVGKMTTLTTHVALPFPQRWVLSSFTPLSILISSGRGLEFVGC